MGQNLIFLNGQEETPICSPAREERHAPLEALYELVGAASNDRFVFTHSSAEAINQVLFSVFLEISRKTGKCHFITSALEDPPTLQMLQRLETLGCFVKIAPVNAKGEIDVAKLEELIGPRTALISICMAQGRTGVIQPVEEIALLAKKHKTLLHLEATHAAGKYRFSFAELGADYLTFSGKHFHAAPHTGGIFAKKSAPLVPLILGQEETSDTAALQTLCAAAQQALLFLDTFCLEMPRLRNKFEYEILARIPDTALLFADSLRLPNTTLITFPRAHQEALHFFLKQKNLHAALGPANDPCSLSFALTRMNTEQEILTAVKRISEAVQELRAISDGVFHA